PNSNQTAHELTALTPTARLASIEPASPSRRPPATSARAILAPARPFARKIPPCPPCGFASIPKRRVLSQGRRSLPRESGQSPAPAAWKTPAGCAPTAGLHTPQVVRQED